MPPLPRLGWLLCCNPCDHGLWPPRSLDIPLQWCFLPCNLLCLTLRVYLWLFGRRWALFVLKVHCKYWFIESPPLALWGLFMNWKPSLHRIFGVLIITLYYAPHRVEKNTQRCNVRSQLVVTLHKYLDFHFLFPVLIGKVEQKPKHQLQIQDKVRWGASTPLGRAKAQGRWRMSRQTNRTLRPCNCSWNTRVLCIIINSGEALVCLCV